jgi:hypothetical protein
MIQFLSVILLIFGFYTFLQKKSSTRIVLAEFSLAKGVNAKGEQGGGNPTTKLGNT